MASLRVGRDVIARLRVNQGLLSGGWWVFSLSKAGVGIEDVDDRDEENTHHFPESGC